MQPRQRRATTPALIAHLTLPALAPRQRRRCTTPPEVPASLPPLTSLPQCHVVKRPLRRGRLATVVRRPHYDRPFSACTATTWGEQDARILEWSAENACDTLFFVSSQAKPRGDSAHRRRRMGGCRRNWSSKPAHLRPHRCLGDRMIQGGRTPSGWEPTAWRANRRSSVPSLPGSPRPSSGAADTQIEQRSNRSTQTHLALP